MRVFSSSSLPERAHPRSISLRDRSPSGLRARVLKIRLRFLPAWISCIARNGYKLPTPDTTGKGPVFPAGTDRIGKYRAAALHCMSIERQEIQALMLAERS